MKSVSDAVYSILQQDQIAYEACLRGVLNLSAYAQEIHSEVEAIAWKSVKKATIVVSLSRIQEKLRTSFHLESLRPVVHIDDISIRAPLCDVSFEKTKKSRDATKKLTESTFYKQNTDFFTITEGVSEITLIAPQRVYQLIIDLYRSKPYEILPKKSYQLLTGISVRFSEQYLIVPNVIYSLISQLAIHRINVIEIVSTLTELVVIVEETDAQKSVDTLRTYMNSGASGLRSK